MSTLTTRAGKGSPLTNNELDANFTNLNADKVEVGGDLSGTSSAPNVAKIQGRAVSTDAPAAGEKLVWSGTAWEPSVDPSGEPIGHADKTQSTISFDSSSRTFTIAPVSSEFVVWCKGVKYTYTSAQTVVIPNTTGLHYIYFSSSGVLSAQMSFFSWEEHAPTAYVYWNAATSTAVYFGDERHGITLDWQTHEYLHRTRGAAIANGFGASNYTTTGTGATDADAQIDIAGGTFFDEDMQVDIVSTNSPVANTWQQDLSGPARIPVMYLSGSAWVIDSPTDFPFKVVGGVPQYNLYSGGTWSTANVNNNEYFVSWILATNNLNYPVLSIISQAPTNQLSQAEAMTFEGLSLSGFPSVEFRPLYKVIYTHKTGFTNSVKASTVAVYDLRSLQSAGVAAALVQDHGNLSGLGDDDHAQYLHVSEVRSPTQTVKNSFLPSQTSNTGKYLSTDGVNPSWVAIPSGSLDFTGDVTGTGTTGSPVALTLANSGVTTGTYSKVTVDAKGRVTSGANIASSDVTTALGFTPENVANKAVANGYASLDSSGKVPSNQLPSYVDDVLEYANLAAFPGTGETGKIYIAIDTVKTYRWSGSAYIEITSSPGSTDAVAEGSTNLYFTNARARAAVSASGSLSYSTLTGVFSYTQPTNVSAFTNDSGYLTGITGAQVTAALGYTPYNATNPAGYTTNVGTVTSVSGTGTVSGLTLTGSVTSSGSLELGGTLTLTSGQVTTALGYTPYNSTNPSGYITSSALSSYLPLTGGTVTGQVSFSKTDDHAIQVGTIRGRVVGGQSGEFIQLYERVHIGSPLGWGSRSAPSYGLSTYGGCSLATDTGSVTIGGNTALHAGNYTSYSPSLTGSGASGTWSINVTGGAGYATYNQILDTRAGQYTPNDYQDYRATYEFTNQFPGLGDWHSAMTLQGWGNTYTAWQIIGPASTSAHENWYLRSGVNTSWNSLRSILHSGNYSSYSPTLTGGNASGTWGISITGNAVTVSSITGNTGLMVNRLTPTGVIDGLTSSNFRTTLFGSGGNAEAIATARWNTTPSVLSGLTSYGTMIAWAASDTHGFLALDYAASSAKIGGGNGQSINWSAMLLHAGNYSSYALPLSGGTVTGYTTFNAGVTVNSGSAAGYGINLYSGNGYQPTYGLYFAQTANFGTYGAVSADWATYFTMNSTANRGWIFREVESLGNVAAISNQGNMTLRSHFEQGNNIARPNVNWSAGSTSNGMVIFYLPGTTSNYGMVHMVFDIYEYNGNAVSTVIVGGHNWSTSWYNVSANVIGQCGKEVRLGFKDNRFCVVFGTSGSTWEYGTIVLRKIHNASFYDNVMNMVGDWSATQTTTESFTNITGDLRALRTPASFNANGAITQSGNQVLHAGNYTSYSPSLGGSGASGTWGINISGSAAQLNGYSSAESGASVVLRTASNGYLYVSNWINTGSGGIFSSVNGAHWYPNNTTTYGTWYMQGSRNGYTGFSCAADNGYIAFMANNSSNTTGVHNQSYGWQFYWESGTFWVAKNTYGGNMAAVLDSSNYTNYSPSIGSTNTLTNIWYFRSNRNTTSDSPPLQAYSNDGGGAIMSFHRGGQYAVNMGLDSDNVFRIGGWSAGTNRLQMDMSGNLTMAGNVTAYSDERLKKDWSPIYEGFVDRLASILAGTYTRIDSNERQAGVSAQAMREILPEVVSSDNEGTLALAYGNAAMVSAVELAKELMQLKRELAELKSRLH